MKLHRGSVENPTRIVTDTDGYWLKEYDEPLRFIPQSTEITRPILRLFGLSAGRWFFGLMTWEKPTTTYMPTFTSTDGGTNG